MRSEFEKLLKQHRDALTDELVKLGKHRQAQLAEWDIEQNESDYEFYFNAAWNTQQSKIDDLQKKNAWLSDVACRENKRANKLQEEKVSTTSLLGKTIQEKNDLQKRVDTVLIKLDERWNESWSNWKEKADMYEQGAANAFEEAYWLLEQALKGCDMKISQELSLSELRGNNV